MKTLLLLDFDDVLNIPLRKPLKENSDYKWRQKSGWDYFAWNSTEFTDSESENRQKYVITTNTEMINSIKSLEDDELCEIIWLTTWLQHSGSLKTIDDIENSAFIERYKFLNHLIGREWPTAGGIGPHHPTYIGAHFIGNWWKWNAVKRLRSQGYRIVFIDDMFARYRKMYKQEELDDEFLKLIRVLGHSGFTKRDFDETKAWLLESSKI